jgi:peptidoglycan/LPS O-acetylase OafA/YrhL
VLPQLAPRHFLQNPHMTGTGFFIACIGAALIIAYWSHRYFEQKLGNWLRKTLLRVLRLD